MIHNPYVCEIFNPAAFSSQEKPSCANLRFMKADFLDIIGHVADIVGLVGIPTLAVATWQLYQDLRERRKLRIVSDQCLEFYDESLKCGVNLVPLHAVTAIPRAGDTVYLPGEEGPDLKNYGGGVYQVTSVDFSYHPAPEVDQPCPAIPAKIVVKVRRFKRDRGASQQ